MLPLGADECAYGTCNFFLDIQICPDNCDVVQDGTSLTMSCTGGLVYTGTRIGDEFVVSVFGQFFPDPYGPCGGFWVSETLVGTFTSADRWEATATGLTFEFEYWDPIFCYDCSFYDYTKPGDRLY